MTVPSKHWTYQMHVDCDIWLLCPKTSCLGHITHAEGLVWEPWDNGPPSGGSNDSDDIIKSVTEGACPSFSAY